MVRPFFFAGVMMSIMSRIHRYLATIIGVQLIFWVVSGFYFTLFPIEEIRGSHLSYSLPSGLNLRKQDILPVEDVTRRVAGLKSVTLKPFLDGPVYEIETSRGTHIVDAASGDRLTPVEEPLALRLAETYWAGDGVLQSLTLMEEPNRESSASGPVWRAEFEGKDTASLYIATDTGELMAVRTTKWRIFDILWGLHIMDWWGRETFTNWWMKWFAGMAIFMAFSGVFIIISQVRRGIFLR